MDRKEVYTEINYTQKSVVYKQGTYKNKLLLPALHIYCMYYPLFSDKPLAKKYSVLSLKPRANHTICCSPSGNPH